ncbi:MAG: iron-sulfur cluster assembly scaffold protein [Spirochaetota bacterium]
MSDRLDDFVNELQERIYKDTLKDYGQKAFDTWNNPTHMGPMENSDGYGCIKGPCGDTMEIFLKFEKGAVRESSFQTDGCGPSMICGSLAAELAFGKTPDEIKKISNETILDTIGGLPEEDQHYALLAANNLHKAVENSRNKKA